MSRHRFEELVKREPQQRTLPAVAVMSGFVVCPLAVQQWLVGRAWQWQIYQRALQEALALAEPSVVDRYQAALLCPN